MTQSNQFLRAAMVSVTAGIMISAISGCSTWNKLNDTEKGAAIGVGSGALIGGAAGGGGGAALGGVAGGVAGGFIGNEVEDRDNRRRR